MTPELLQAHVKSGELIKGYGKISLLRELVDALVCDDGFRVSIQASVTHYCSPRDNDGPYSSFELGFPSSADDLITKYADDPDKPTGTVYGYVPLAVVLALIEKHGGVK